MLDPITERIVDDQLMLKHGFSLNEFEDLLKKDMETLNEMKLVNKDVVVKSYNHNMKVLKKVLVDHGVSVIKLQSHGKRAADIVRTAQSSGKSPKIAANLVIKKVITPAVSKAVKGAKYNEKEKEDPSVIIKIGKSLVVFAAVVIVNTFLMALLGIPVAVATGSPMAVALVCHVVIAPFVEEYAKYLSILEGYPWIYTGIFSGLEAMKYIVSILALGHSLTSALIVRALAVMMHFTTTWIQKHYREKDNEATESNMMGKSYYVAVGLHAVWNLVGTVFAKEITSFMS